MEKIKNKLSILVSAFACHPSKGSEESVGWNWTKQISKNYSVLLMTQEKNISVIEKVVLKENLRNIQIVKVKDPLCLDFVIRINYEIGIRIYYLYWQLLVYLQARKVIKCQKVDIIHHITFVMLAVPSFLSFLGKPFVWNVAGGQFISRHLLGVLRIKNIPFELVRTFFQLFLKLNPIWIYSLKKTNRIICSNKETYRFLPKFARYKAVVHTQIGINSCDIKQIVKLNNSNFIYIIIARLIPLKGISLAIVSLNKVVRVNKSVSLIIVGDGSEFNYLKKMATNLNLSNNIHFVGKCSQQQTLSWLSRSHALLFPSLRDSAGMVILEAFFLGKPVIALDRGGARIFINEQAGFRIGTGDRDSIINGLSEKMLLLAQNSFLYNSMSRASLKRAAMFDWKRLSSFLIQEYNKLI